MTRVYASLLVLCLVLSACSTAPPLPVDRYFRLQPTSVSAGPLPAGRIALQPLRADGLYAERAVVFTEEANPRQLRQYHYHLWLYAPAQLVHDHLVASLGSVLDSEGKAPISLDARIVRFDRVLAGKSTKAAAALEVTLSAKRTILLAKTYQAEHAAENESFAAFVAAMEQALGKIYAEFLRDADTASAAARTRG